MNIQKLEEKGNHGIKSLLTDIQYSEAYRMGTGIGPHEIVYSYMLSIKQHELSLCQA